MSTARCAASCTISSRACSISKARSGARCRCSPGGPGETHPPLHRRRARAVHLAGRAVSCLPSSLMFAALNLTGSARSGTRQLTCKAALKTDHSTDEAIAASMPSSQAASEAREAGRRGHRTSTATSRPARSLKQTARASLTPRRRRQRSRSPTRTPADVRAARRLDPAVHQACQGQSAAGRLSPVQDAASKYSLAADPDLGAVHVAAVPVPPALQAPTTTRCS